MKLEIYDSVPKNKVVRLRLVEGHGNSILLQVVDANGERLSGGSLLTITEKEVEIHSAISSDFGFSTDAAGRLLVRNL